MDHLLHQLLERAADAAPDRLAVVDGERTLTYTELEHRANQVANLLRELGVLRGDRVGLYLDKSAEAIVALYGTLKADAAYVPLDPSAPAARLSEIAQDCGIEVLVSSSEKAARWGAIAGERPMTFVSMSPSHEAENVGDLPAGSRVVGRAEIDAQPGGRPATKAISFDLAYVLYTSGSTGQPKGVMLTHDCGLTFVEWAAAQFGIAPEDRLSNHAPLHFDLSILDIFAAARAGAAVVLVPRRVAMFPVELARLIDREEITLWYSVPSALTMLTDRGNLAAGDLPSLRLVLFAGEVFPTHYLRRLMHLLPHARFANLYGPTETNVCTWYEVPPLAEDQTEPIPIGKAIADVEVFAVTEDERRAEPGEIGELYVRGPTLMKAYWRKPGRSKEVLVQHPFSRDIRDPAYKTGDLVQEGADGNYRFIGRRDGQIKSRGYRIELGEIEAALHANADVLECAIVAVPDDLVTNRLAAAVVTSNDVGPGELAAFCAERIPSYMIPEVFDIRSALPKTSTGKIDRPALLAELTEQMGASGKTTSKRA